MNVQRVFLLVALFIIAPVTLAAQPFLPLKMEQDRIPYSTGDTVPWYLDLTNLTSDTIEVWIYFQANGYEAYFISYRDTADFYTVSSSRFPDTTAGSRHLIVPPHALTPDVRVPFWFNSIDSFHTTKNLSVGITTFDSVTKKYWQGNAKFTGIGPCLDPVELLLGNGITIGPAIIGQHPAFLECTTEKNRSYQLTSTIDFKIVGEYSDRFYISPHDTIPPQLWWIGSLAFYGAPKQIVYDTLVAVYSNNCAPTIERRYPLTCYSYYDSSHIVQVDTTPLVAPFLGYADTKVKVKNMSELEVTARSLHLSGRDSANFRIVGVPPSIAPHDSGYITVRLLDNDKWKECGISGYNSRQAGLSGTIVPVSGDIAFIDSSFTVSLFGKIDVYCPDYFSLVPLLKQGIHPTGIIFNTLTSSFHTIYGNDDQVAEEYYQPYYEDSHFTLETGSFTFPAKIEPHFDWISTQTKFTGDQNHTILTKLIWPREFDTIKIDVLALSPFDKPFDNVTTNSSQALRLWPNPASTMIQVEIPTEETVTVTITDVLARMIKRVGCTGSPLTIDVSDLPPGLYNLSLSSRSGTTLFEVFR